MQFTPTFFLHFYAILEERFKDEWLDSPAPASNLQVWGLKVELLNKKTQKLEEHYVVKQKLNVNDRYFYQRLKNAEKGKKLIGVKDSVAVACYQYLSCKGRNRLSLERVGELRRVESRVNFVVTKRQSDDQTVATTDRPSMGRNFALL